MCATSLKFTNLVYLDSINLTMKTRTHTHTRGRIFQFQHYNSLFLLKPDPNKSKSRVKLRIKPWGPSPGIFGNFFQFFLFLNIESSSLIVERCSSFSLNLAFSRRYYNSGASSRCGGHCPRLSCMNKKTKRFSSHKLVVDLYVVFESILARGKLFPVIFT